MIEILKAILFGIVEGITEWLPISSTGHMILLNELVPMKVSDTFMDMFLVVVQLGAIMAVVIIFWKDLFPFSFHGGNFIKKDIFSMWFKVMTACIPAIVVELLFGDQLEELFYNYQTVAIMLILFGFLFLLVEWKKKGKESTICTIAQITYMTAFWIGMFQLIAAVFPGTSRSGATIIGALLIGVSRKTAAEFTFFLAVPVMFGASLIKLLKFGLDFTASEACILAVGMITAFSISIFVIRFLMEYIKKHDFKIFGYYRIVLGIVILLYFGWR